MTGRMIGATTRRMTQAPVRAVFLLGLPLVAACNPTVKVEAPDKPIVINMNVKVDQEVRIRLDKDVQELLSDRQDIF